MANRGAGADARLVLLFGDHNVGSGGQDQGASPDSNKIAFDSSALNFAFGSEVENVLGFQDNWDLSGNVAVGTQNYGGRDDNDAGSGGGNYVPVGGVEILDMGLNVSNKLGNFSLVGGNQSGWKNICLLTPSIVAPIQSVPGSSNIFGNPSRDNTSTDALEQNGVNADNQEHGVFMSNTTSQNCQYHSEKIGTTMNLYRSIGDGCGRGALIYNTSLPSLRDGCSSNLTLLLGNQSVNADSKLVSARVNYCLGGPSYAGLQDVNFTLVYSAQEMVTSSTTTSDAVLQGLGMEASLPNLFGAAGERPVLNISYTKTEGGQGDRANLKDGGDRTRVAASVMVPINDKSCLKAEYEKCEGSASVDVGSSTLTGDNDDQEDESVGVSYSRAIPLGPASGQEGGVMNITLFHFKGESKIGATTSKAAPVGVAVVVDAGMNL